MPISFTMYVDLLTWTCALVCFWGRWSNKLQGVSKSLQNDNYFYMALCTLIAIAKARPCKRVHDLSTTRSFLVVHFISQKAQLLQSILTSLALHVKKRLSDGIWNEPKAWHLRRATWLGMESWFSMYMVWTIIITRQSILATSPLFRYPTTNR